MKFIEKVLDNVGRSWDRDAHQVPAITIGKGTGVHSLVTIERQYIHLHTKPFHIDMTEKSTIDLGTVTLAQLKTALEALGYTVVLSTQMASGEYPALKALCLMTASGTALPTVIDTFTSPLWKFLYPIHRLLESCENNIESGIRQMFLPSTRDSWIDYWATFFNLARMLSESDDDFIRRVYVSLFAPRTNNISIREALKFYTGTEATVEDDQTTPARFIVGVDPIYLESATAIVKVILAVKGAGIDYILTYTRTFIENYGEYLSDKLDKDFRTSDELTIQPEFAEHYGEQVAEMFTYNIDDTNSDVLVLNRTRRNDSVYMVMTEDGVIIAEASL